MTEKLITVAVYSTPYEANMVKSKLEANGIPAFVADEYTIGMNWLYSNALGGVKVQVPESLVPEALEVLRAEPVVEELRKIDEAKACPKCGSRNTEDYLDKRGSFLTWVLSGFPLFLPKEKKKCNACGNVWNEPEQ